MSFVHIITNHEISAVQAIPIYSFYGSLVHYELVNISQPFLYIRIRSTHTHAHILEFEHIQNCINSKVPDAFVLANGFHIGKHTIWYRMNIRTVWCVRFVTTFFCCCCFLRCILFNLIFLPIFPYQHRKTPESSAVQEKVLQCIIINSNQKNIRKISMCTCLRLFFYS